MSASDPLTCALRLLSARDRSVAELSAGLQQRGYPEEEIQETVQRCSELGYLDDQRYAHERARALARSGRAAGSRILLDLRRRGISEELAVAALSAAEAELAPEQMLRDLLERRFPGFDYAHADERQKRRVLSFFQRRGFSLEQIFAIIRQERDL
ncbi:regulatory protein [Geoalkalibacter ferrihydriticus]|uniref:Regulatory protein RecX n=2 Tax=Geoalkalibacter ferrihydriticus TaxID=392333 RepID=A0A0C2ECF3_9BACT|nr:regulatory protein RecX [Geoalkalibacter ferrihydriticus]KIH76273.1 hypothetical protein GFER_11695 [Geoalkalibacter ferrihydriticus DSM 17813]SDL23397.1 regulatory protein [Geoalkalibacter ferrihydriticus]